jgi:hypothetical protein
MNVGIPLEGHAPSWPKRGERGGRHGHGRDETRPSNGWPKRTEDLMRTNLELAHVIDEREKTILNLEKAIKEVKTLQGILPICASCKKIRDDQGYWNQVDTYIHEHSGTEFSHGICPDCAKKLYPEFVKEEEP